MKIRKTNPLIYFAYIISVGTLIIFYAVAYKNLKSTLTQKEDEKVVLKMMYHLDKIQGSLVTIELNEKPFLIYNNNDLYTKFEVLYQYTIKESNSLRELCGEKNIPCNDILQLDSLLKKQLNYSQIIIDFSKQGKFDSVSSIVNNDSFISLQRDLTGTYETISTFGRNYLQRSNNTVERESREVYLLLGLIGVGTILFLSFIFWRLLLQMSAKEQLQSHKKIYERVKDGFLATDINYNITYLNKAINVLLGLHGKKIYGQNVFQSLPALDKIENREIINDSFKKQEKKSLDFFEPKTERWYRVNIFPSYNGISMYFNDISITKKADEEIHKSKRLYEFISKTNDLILHAKNEDEIIAEICNIAVQSGGFIFAWIGMIDNTTETVKPVIWAGHEDDYLNTIIKISSKDIPEGRGPSGKAIREGKHYYSNDIENDPVMAIWRVEALKRGYRSSISLPIKTDEKVIYNFTIYASKPFFYTEEEVQLLLRVTENISYAFHTFNIDNKRKIAENQLKKVSQAVEQSSASVVITDLAGNIEYVNPAFSKLTGYSFEETIGQNPKILKSDHTTAAEYEHLWQDITHNREWQGIFCNKKKNGELYWEYAIISPIVNEEGTITNFVAVKENITERIRLEEEQKQLITIFENTTAYVATADLYRNFLYGNKAIKDILEIKDDITNYNINDFRSEAGKLIINDINSTLFELGKWIGENEYQSLSGKKIPVLQVMVLHKNTRGEPTHISTTAIDISKIKVAEKELVRLNDELRDLSKHLQDISESDKKDIAREIHDELGQGLTALKFGVSWIKRHIDDDKTLVEKKVDELLEEISETMNAFRRIYTSLHPAILEELGLYGAVEWLMNSFNKSSNFPVSFSTNIEHESIDFDRSLVLYRIIQESLTNVVRYASATSVLVSLQKETNSFKLHIEDNGIGFEISKVDTKLHHGILGMRERVYAINGKFNIISENNKGTVIDVEIPQN